MPVQQNSTQTRSPYSVERSSEASTSSRDFKQYISHLLSISQDLCGQTRGVTERLCQEIAHITQGRVQLVLRGQESAKTSTLRYAITFPVLYHQRDYGTLFFISASSEPAFAQVFLNDIENLARTCGGILYLLENAALVQRQGKGPGTLNGAGLSKRERDVLELMSRGLDREGIARALKIATGTINKHRQSIYAKLGVRCESEAILAAYHAGLFSPLEGILPEHNACSLQDEGEQRD